MPVYIVTRKSDGAEVTRYAAAAVTEGVHPLADFDHSELVEGMEPAPPDRPQDWHINIGPFFDRFGQFKLPILASTDPVVQAIIKDATVRKYIDLKGRRAELLQAIGVLQSKGFALDAAAILDVRPTADEVAHG